MEGPDLAKWGLEDPWLDPRKASQASAADALAVQQALASYMLYLQTVRWLRRDDRMAVRECEKQFDMAHKTAMVLASILKAPGV
jgi:hypothetical protein